MSHTPGPWKVAQHGWYVFEDKNIIDKLVCVVAHNKAERTQEAKDNAILISTAPDGLALAEFIMNSDCGGKGFTLNRLEQISRMARALVAKAGAK